MTEIFQNLRWLDLLDIAIVAFLVYRLFLLIQGTRAIQMLIGLVFLFLASFISSKMGLHTLQWIFAHFLSVLVLAVIIIFQPEMRRALANMGRAPFFQQITPPAKAQVLEEIVRAAIFLAGRRVGALIVLQRETELSNYVEEGVTLDAKVTRELLTSVFLPSSPIHDGAVIIKDDRVLTAGAFLPLSLDPRVGKELGTRHRAAIGISEETDAVVVVISEESGIISMVMDGRMQRHLDGSALRERLQKLFVVKKKD